MPTSCGNRVETTADVSSKIVRVSLLLLENQLVQNKPNHDGSRCNLQRCDWILMLVDDTIRCDCESSDTRGKKIVLPEHGLYAVTQVVALGRRQGKQPAGRAWGRRTPGALQSRRALRTAEGRPAEPAAGHRHGRNHSQDDTLKALQSSAKAGDPQEFHGSLCYAVAVRLPGVFFGRLLGFDSPVLRSWVFRSDRPEKCRNNFGT